MSMQRSLADFIALESTGGVVLFISAVLALVVCNVGGHAWYLALKSMPLGLHVLGYGLTKPLILWVNEGFMTVFFFLIGLEIKKEMVSGALNQRHKIMLPAWTALGGIVVPACIYWALTQGKFASGWAIPTATDIAFSLGILSLFGSRVPLTVKFFLMAIAIFDDIAAIAIIAIFYTASLSWLALTCAAVLLAILTSLSLKQYPYLWAYLLVGTLLWVAVLQSGMHATLAGFLTAILIPTDLSQPKSKPSLDARIHGWVAYGILPVFAFFNCGISFASVTHADLYHPVTQGILFGLCIGKPLGIVGSVVVAVKCKWAKLPDLATWRHIVAVAWLCGVGFTMSLFIGDLAFTHHHASAWIKMGVMLGSLVSGLLGAGILSLPIAKRSES